MPLLVSSQEVESFFTQYYNTLIKTPSSLTNFFAENAQLSISNENSLAKTHTKDFDRVIKDTHRKEISKVMIVSYNYHTIDTMTIIALIVQVCYDDSSNLRFVENLCMNENGMIVSSMIKFLNEEIVYGKEEKRTGMVPINGLVSNARMSVCVKNGGKLTYREINELFKSFGTIIAYERKKDHNGITTGEAFIEFDTEEGVNLVIKNASSLKEKGIEIDQDKKYYRSEPFLSKRI